MAVILYLDSSALVKLVLDEPDSGHAEELWEAARVGLTSRLAYPEARAALASAARGGRIAGSSLRLAARTLDRHLEELYQIDVDAEVARLAGDVTERFRLRGGDAVHLATVLLVATPDTRLATWDRELARAANEAGIEVVPARP